MSAVVSRFWIATISSSWGRRDMRILWTGPRSPSELLYHANPDNTFVDFKVSDENEQVLWVRIPWQTKPVTLSGLEFRMKQKNVAIEGEWSETAWTECTIASAQRYRTPHFDELEISLQPVVDDNNDNDTINTNADTNADTNDSDEIPYVD